MVLVSSDRILPAVRLLPTFGMVLAVAGSCHPEVAQFVPRDISSVTWPAFVVTPGCAPQDHNSSSNTFQVHSRNIQPQIFHMDNRNDKEKFLPKSLQGVACCCCLYDLFQLYFVMHSIQPHGIDPIIPSCHLLPKREVSPNHTTLTD